MWKNVAVVLALSVVSGLTGCTPALFRNLEMQPVSPALMSRGSLLPAFDRMTQPKNFYCEISFKEKQMAGVMSMNQEEKGRYRVLLLSTFGPAIFDFTISRDSFIVNSCMEQMNKKVVLNLLEKDLRAVLMLNIPDKFRARFYRTNVHPDWMGYGVNADDGECDYLIRPQGAGFVRTVQNGGAVKRMNATFDEQVITITHPKLGLTITAKELTE